MATRPETTTDTTPRRSGTGHSSPKVQRPLDRRVRKTQRLLRDALVTLILERGWDAVTVRDVCERADVGRSTFYVHFADKESLLVSGFDDLDAHLTELTRSAKGPFAFAEVLMEHACENERLFRAVVGRQSGQHVEWRFLDLVSRAIGQELETLEVPTAAHATTTRFLTGGFVQLLTQLLEHGARKETSASAAAFRRLASGVVRVAKSW